MDQGHHSWSQATLLLKVWVEKKLWGGWLGGVGGGQSNVILVSAQVLLGLWTWA